jgi:energy-coupling factor transport system permease protein
MINQQEQPKTDELSGMDGLIKFILAILLAVLPFLVQSALSLSIISVCFVIVTLASRIKPKSLLISAASYGIIVLIPYLFGLIMNALISSFSNNALFVSQQGPYESFLRLFRLFIIWFVSILYFHTTPMKTVLGMLDKLLSPLKLLGAPIDDYLKVIMCVVIELKSMGTEVKKELSEKMHSVMGESGRIHKLNIKGISQIIVSIIVDSFGKLDRIESFVENVTAQELYYYRFKLSLKDGLVVIGFALFATLVWMIEKGHLSELLS